MGVKVGEGLVVGTGVGCSGEGWARGWVGGRGRGWGQGWGGGAEGSGAMGVPEGVGWGWVGTGDGVHNFVSR